MRPGLDGTRALLGALGHPERAFAVVHVAGTNGKGSTAAFLEAILRMSGRRTGLYTSPHLLRFTERARVDGAELPRAEVAEHGARALQAARQSAAEATFFEIATALAFSAFAARGVEIAVVEAGLGGRLDATNVVERPLVTLVTSIAFDHTDVLGPTLADIAREKAGIFKRGAPAVLACDDAAARAVLEAQAVAVGAPAHVYGRDFDDGGLPPLGLLGAHQRRNAALARRAAELLPPAFSPSPAAIARGLGEARWPGRLEALGPDLVIDAAHNGEGAVALAAALPALAAGRPVTLVLGVVADKDAAPIVAPLVPLASEVILTRPPTPRARDPESLLPLAPAARVIADPATALAAARARPGLTVVAGSIFLVGAVRRLVTGEPADALAVQDPAATPPMR